MRKNTYTFKLRLTITAENIERARDLFDQMTDDAGERFLESFQAIAGRGEDFEYDTEEAKS